MIRACEIENNNIKNWSIIDYLNTLINLTKKPCQYSSRKKKKQQILAILR